MAKSYTYEQLRSMNARPSDVSGLSYDQVLNKTNGFASVDNGKSIGGFIQNVASSGINAVKGIGEAIIHPYDTLSGVAKLGSGVLEKGINAATGSKISSEDTQAVDNVTNFFKDRYGSLDKAKETAYKDPVGFALDLSALFSGAGSLAGKAGTLSKVSELSKAGSVATTISEAIDPIRLATKSASYVGGKVADVAGKTGAIALGASSGAGTDIIKQAFRNPSPEFTSALRGNTTAGSIVEDATSALDSIKAKRSADYTSKLAEIKGANTNSLDISTLKKQLDSRLAEFGVKKTSEGLDFSRSTIDPSEVPRVKAIAETINDWGSQAGDRTAIGLDLLKRRLADFYSPNSRQANAFVQPLKNSVKGILVDQVPGYEGLVSKYEEASNLIEDVQRGLSLKDSVSVDTTFKKLTSSLRQNQEFRQELLRSLENSSGKDLSAKIAGQQLSESLPRGLQKYAAGLALSGGVYAGLSLSLLPIIALSSPRVVGEFVRALGLTAKQVEPYIATLEKIRLDPVAKAALNDLYSSTSQQ